jgi:hypothetical protein
MPGYVERATNISNILLPPDLNIHHIIGTNPSMVQKYNTPMPPIPLRFLMRRQRSKLVQEIIGTFLFYARAIDNTMLKPLRTLSTQQSQPTEMTMNAIIKFLNYTATHPNAKLKYTASDMILWIDSDASYLAESKARSTCAKTFFLSDNPANPSKAPQPQDPEATPNAPVHMSCVPSCVRLYLLQLKLNLEDSFTMVKTDAQSVPV